MLKQINYDQDATMTYSPPPEEQPALSAAGRVVWTKRLTWKLLERLPQLPTVVEEPSPAETVADATPQSPSVTNFVWKVVHTVKNSFGMYREFPCIPTHNPDDFVTLDQLSDVRAPPATTDSHPTENSPFSLSIVSMSESPSTSYAPFANSSIFGLMNWMWTGSAMKSVSEMVRLVDFLKSDDFKKEDITGFDVRKETTNLDKSLEFDKTHDGSDGSHDGWREAEIEIQVPDGQIHASDDDIPTFSVPGLHYRSLTAIIKSAFQDPASKCFHYTPFKCFWKPGPTEPPQRVHDKIYSSDAMVEAYVELWNGPREPGCDLEQVIAAVMYWSDSTHLANFGTAALWPLYIFFGNQSKWLRGKPRTASCHHAAYIPKASPIFLDAQLPPLINLTVT